MTSFLDKCNAGHVINLGWPYIKKMFFKISIISVPKIVLLSSKAQFSSDLHLTARLKETNGPFLVMCLYFFSDTRVGVAHR